MKPARVSDLLTQLGKDASILEDVVRYLVPAPQPAPQVEGIDVWGGTLPAHGPVTGQRIAYVDFARQFDLPVLIRQAAGAGRTAVAHGLAQCQHTSGLALLDVAGHSVADALLATTLHEAFLLGVAYELDLAGRVTRRLYDHLNALYCRSSSTITHGSWIYVEVSTDAPFRCLSAGHPLPLIFSRRHDRFVDLDPDTCATLPPLGSVTPGGRGHEAPEWAVPGAESRRPTGAWAPMGAGDILLIYTDGLAGHRRADEDYFPDRLERTLRKVKEGIAQEIFVAIQQDLVAFTDQTDDISMVVVKLGS